MVNGEPKSVLRRLDEKKLQSCRIGVFRTKKSYNPAGLAFSERKKVTILQDWRFPVLK
jgi:hypothetical protein